MTSTPEPAALRPTDRPATATAAADGDAGPVLRIRDLTVAYRTAGGGEVPALRGVSLDLPAGTKLGIAGESGCGKSTLATAVLRLLPETARLGGEVLFDGEDVLAMRWGRLRAVRWAGASIVFQGAMHSLNPVRRIGDQIAEPLRLHRTVPDDRVAERVAGLLEQVGLPGARAAAYPHELSGGQRQRVMIAMALACDPALIIADEPTTALDVMIQAQILRLLEQLVDEKSISLLMISHDLSVLADTCDRLAVMYAGRIVEEGPADQVFSTPRHPYSAALGAAFPAIGDPAARRRPQGLAGDPPDPADLPPGCSFHPRCARAEERCTRTEPLLAAAGPERRAACLLVGADGAADGPGVDSAGKGPAADGAADAGAAPAGAPAAAGTAAAAEGAGAPRNSETAEAGTNDE